jgi:hypothetical protein
VTKFNSDGSSTIYSTYLGGDQDDAAISLVLDDTGTVFVTGYTFSSNFPIAGPALQPISGGLEDAFVSVLNAIPASLEAMAQMSAEV